MRIGHPTTRIIQPSDIVISNMVLELKGFSMSSSSFGTRRLEVNRADLRLEEFRFKKQSHCCYPPSSRPETEKKKRRKKCWLLDTATIRESLISGLAANQTPRSTLDQNRSLIWVVGCEQDAGEIAMLMRSDGPHHRPLLLLPFTEFSY